jgi:hypothetical protein
VVVALRLSGELGWDRSWPFEAFDNLVKSFVDELWLDDTQSST